MTMLQRVPVAIMVLAMTCQSFFAVPAALAESPQTDREAAAAKKPLKVYILAGQSNMGGRANKSTLEHIKLLPESAEAFKDLFDENGEPVELDDVWVVYEERSGKLAPRFGGGRRGENNFGPEYAFGIYMHKALREPILLIKTAWGGASLSHDFRPPSAGEWTSPPGDPDLIDKGEQEQDEYKIPIPEKLDLPDDFVPGEDILPRYARRVGYFMGIRPMRGVPLDEVNGVHPLYIASAPGVKLEGSPFQEGDLIIGLNGQGMREDAVGHWREEFHGAFSRDWLLRVTRWRKGKIETFDFDLSYTLEGGRDDIEKAKEEARARAVQASEERRKTRGRYYRTMIEDVQKVLGDIQSVYPGYDPEQGYELAGFAWFQGWNDLVDTGTYPNREEPGGYDQYSWLLTHFIKDVRKDLNAPDLPFVIGAMGVGGFEDPPKTRFGHLQQAMAAPAADPEFKGTVAAVQTGKYWDKQLDELIQRSAEVSVKRIALEREKGLTGEALDKAYAECRAQRFTPLEEEILRTGRSDKGFHYHGSGKIMAGIGKGFAEAMLELQKNAK